MASAMTAVSAASETRAFVASRRFRWLTPTASAWWSGGRALRADIHHPPCPVQPAKATTGLNRMARPLGLELDSDPLLHYSARQDTLIRALEAA